MTPNRNETSAMNSQTSYRAWIPNIFAFIFGIGIARVQEWETSDLVWSLWLSSLVSVLLPTGYLLLPISSISFPGEFSDRKPRTNNTSLCLQRAHLEGQRDDFAKMTVVERARYKIDCF